MVLVATKDFEGSDDIEYPIINTFHLLSRTDRIGVLLKSVYLKIRTKWFVWVELMKLRKQPLEKYFLKNVPTRLYFAVKENTSFNKFFKRYGAGILIMKGPIVYKGVGLDIHNARKYGIRVLSIAGRILTSNRLTNCFLDVHESNGFPKVLPHSMVVTDKISYESIQNQGKNIEIYVMQTEDSYEADVETRHDPFSVTLVLQKKDEMESMIDEVVEAVRNLKILSCILKCIPTFKCPIN